MTRLFTLSLILGFTINSAFSQTLELEIIHKLNRESFSYTQEGITSLDHVFTVSRLEYYVSEIVITHDSGQQSSIDSLWVLINGDEATSTIDLSELSVDSVESVSMHIGVSPGVNNLDPAEWPMAHPLAPKNPSMHWGWLAGYRFVAMEGNAESQDYQIHALGNDNYFETSFTPNVTIDGATTTMSIYADYSKALKDIDLSVSVITHGEEDESIDLLENFRDYVFTPTEPIDSVPAGTGGNDTTDSTTGIIPMTAEISVKVWPNPSSNGAATLESTSNMSQNQIVIFDRAGRLINAEMTAINQNRIDISNLESGVYFIRIQDDKSEQRTMKKLVVLE